MRLGYRDCDCCICASQGQLPGEHGCVLQGGDVGEDVLIELVLSPPDLNVFYLPQQKKK